MTTLTPQLAIAPTEPTEPAPTAAEATLARRKALRESPLFARIWRLTIALREADDLLAPLLDDLGPTAVAKIFEDAGLAPAEDDRFGNKAFSGILRSLRAISCELGEQILAVSAEIAVLAAPDEVLRPAA